MMDELFHSFIVSVPESFTGDRKSQEQMNKVMAAKHRHLYAVGAFI
jgi:hypothetical protein